MASNNIYKKLAQHLDSFPQGFPATDSGKELTLLAHLFTPDEAGLALALSLDDQPIEQILEKAGMSKSGGMGLVKSMVTKGLVNMLRSDRGIEISLLPFVVGFYERQVFRMDDTFAQLFEDYYHEAQQNLLSVEPQFHRVIPIHQTIPVDIEIHPEESLMDILSKKQAWAVFDCVCRKQRHMLNQACDHPIKVCLAMSDSPGAFDHAPEMDALDLQGALAVLDFAAQAGLVHTVSNQKDGVSYVCNCCSCGCGLLRGMADLKLSNVVARSTYFASVDEALCTACGMCAASCQFTAIEIDQVARVEKIVCTGCGLCVRVCPEEAINMFQRSPGEIKPIPENTEDWLSQRQQARGLSST